LMPSTSLIGAHSSVVVILLPDSGCQGRAGGTSARSFALPYRAELPYVCCISTTLGSFRPALHAALLTPGQSGCRSRCC
jgi:hypothetical protein